MTSLQKISVSLIAGALLATVVLLVLRPGPGHAHNLQYVACDTAKVGVDPANGTTDKNDEIIFLCKGQTATWIASTSSGNFTISFADASLFGQLSYTSTPGATANTVQIGPLIAAIDPPPGSHAKDFKYQLMFNGGKQFDPHVIIMGP